MSSPLLSIDKNNNYIKPQRQHIWNITDKIFKLKKNWLDDFNIKDDFSMPFDIEIIELNVCYITIKDAFRIFKLKFSL